MENINNINFLFDEMQELDRKIFPDKNRNQDWFLKVLNEEISELLTHQDSINQVEEVGDILFVIASYCRLHKIDIVQAMQFSVVKMRDRAKRNVYAQKVEVTEGHSR